MGQRQNGSSGLLHNLRFGLANAIAPRRNPQREIWPYGDGSYSGYRLAFARRLPELRTDPYGLALAAETSVWASACIRLCSSSVSRMRFELTDAAGNVLENTPFHAMMKTARLDYQQNLFYLWVQSLCVHGETYMEKVTNNEIPGFDIPGGLRILNAIAITPQVRNGAIQYYQYSANGGRYQLAPYELFIHRYTSLTDDYRATAPMVTAMDAVGIKRSMQSFLRGYMDNDATPGGIVTPKAGVNANKDWITNVMTMWGNAFKGTNNANATGFIPAEVDYKQFDRKIPDHPEVLSNDQIGEICAAFRVPVDMVKTNANKDPLGGGGKMDSSRQMFYEDFVEPTCEDIAQYINDVVIPWLMPNSGVTFAFDFDEIRSLINDTKERSDKIRAEFDGGNITFNEMRVALDYEPVEGGDWYKFQTTGVVMIQSSQIAQAPALIAAAVAAAKPAPPPQPTSPAALPPPAENKDLLPQLPATVPPTGKSAALMLNLGNHPDLVGLQNKTRAYVGDTPVKWSDPNSFHVTLASMPIVTDEQMTSLQDAIKDVEIPDMALKVGSLGTFDNLDSHAVHFKVRKSVDLLDLQETVHDLINGLGIPMSSFSAPEAYKPHITMGYADSKPPARTFDSHLTVKPTALHLGVGDEIVYQKPIGGVVTPEPHTPPEDKKPIEEVKPIKSEDGLIKPNEDDITSLRLAYNAASASKDYTDSALDELAQWEKKVKNKGVKAAFVNYLIQDELAQALRDNLVLAGDNKEAVKALFEETKEKLSVKSIQSTRLDFENAFDDTLKEAMAGNLTRTRWGNIVRQMIRTYGARAFRDGLADSGVDDIPDEEEQATIDNLIQEQSQYVTRLGQQLFKTEEGISPAMADQKSGMWFNGSINPFYSAGVLAGDGNAMHIWVLGRAENHCKDCPRLDGQKRRYKTWFKQNLIAGTTGQATECGGWECDCKLKRVAGKSSEGDLAELIHEHASEPAEVAV